MQIANRKMQSEKKEHFDPFGKLRVMVSIVEP
jgi:hypothetical protein